MNTPKKKQTPNAARTKSARACALDSLMALERDGKYANLEVNARLERSDLSPADRALYTRLVYGVTERRITLDWILAHFSRIPLDQMDADVKCAARMGLYQLLYMDKIPDHAAVGETAGLVSGSRTGFVNAILRSFLRAGKDYPMPPENSDEGLSVKHSVPVPLVQLFRKAVGAETDALLEAMNREPKVGLRINTLRQSAEEAAEQVGGTVSKWARDIVLVDSLTDEIRAGLESGDWFVQDEASRAASLALGAAPGETVVDTCACPGGKSFSIALDMHNEGRVFSFDLHKNKLSLIEKGASRLGISIIGTAARDARVPDESLIGQADRVLCDAPCSGLGVIAKKPDIRYKNLADAENLPAIQKAVLDGASKYVRPGGVLVYSTCTLNPAENEAVVADFLASHPDFHPDDGFCGGMKTFLPHRDGCDGFFAARMVRGDSEKKTI